MWSGSAQVRLSCCTGSRETASRLASLGQIGRRRSWHDVLPLGLAVLRHVVGGDLVRDALVAQNRCQPIEQRRRVVATDGSGNSLALQLVQQIGRASEAADPVNEADRMVERRKSARVISNRGRCACMLDAVGLTTVCCALL